MHNIAHIHMKYTTTPDDITRVLFQPKTLIRLFAAWLFVVVIGSGIAISVTNMRMLSDAEVETILSENERLAEAANVAYQHNTQEQLYTTDSIPVFPDRLMIPSIGTDLPISNPQTRDIAALDEALKTAAVRYPDSATLGQRGGNVLLFGHSSRLPVVRNQLYKAFNDIETLTNGDVIYVQSGSETYTYEVTNVYQASANDDKIALAVDGHRLTLLTCDSFGAKTDRWVVEAEFIGKTSTTAYSR